MCGIFSRTIQHILHTCFGLLLFNPTPLIFVSLFSTMSNTTEPFTSRLSELSAFTADQIVAAAAAAAAASCGAAIAPKRVPPLTASLCTSPVNSLPHQVCTAVAQLLPLTIYFSRDPSITAVIEDVRVDIVRSGDSKLAFNFRCFGKVYATPIKS